MRFRTLLVLGLVAALTGCSDRLPFADGETRVFAGPVEVDGRTLNRGYVGYTRYCAACHGEAGDGKGPAAPGYRPAPRDLRLGLYKFARLQSSDDLPPDEDLRRIVRDGLGGTPMAGWDIPADELDAVIAYTKTFAPERWQRTKRSGELAPTLPPWAPPPDPWTGAEAEAVRRGEAVFHLRAECASCHPAYLPRPALIALGAAYAAREPGVFRPVTSLRDDPHGAIAKRSPEYEETVLPPDFLLHPLKSVRPGREVADVMRVVSTGVYPVMPAWQGALPDRDLWALAHYVADLARRRGTPEGLALAAVLAADE